MVALLNICTVAADAKTEINILVQPNVGRQAEQSSGGRK
jgi:hypothetical protein